jgi:hypothetical protein
MKYTSKYWQKIKEENELQYSKNRSVLEKIYELNYKYDIINQIKRKSDRYGYDLPDRAYVYFHKVSSDLVKLVNYINKKILDLLEDNWHYFVDDNLSLEEADEMGEEYFSRFKTSKTLSDKMILMHESLMMIHHSGVLAGDLLGLNTHKGLDRSGKKAKRFLDKLSNMDQEILDRLEQEAMDEIGSLPRIENKRHDH